jgi:hypothetical protein
MWGSGSFSVISSPCDNLAADRDLRHWDELIAERGDLSGRMILGLQRVSMAQDARSSRLLLRRPSLRDTETG